MTKEEVIDYYHNMKNSVVRREFAKRWTEEHEGKVWKEEFFPLLTNQILSNCFRVLFVEKEINILEDPKTGQILKLL